MGFTSSAATAANLLGRFKAPGTMSFAPSAKFWCLLFILFAFLVGEALSRGYDGINIDFEPLTDPSDPLLSHPKMIATPHIGFVTEDEFDKQFADIFEQVNAYAAGAPIHMINPSVYAP